jgi:cob(I)alamin adenosyltransferase
MKIYTKSGDAGLTGLLGGERVTKNSPRIGAYGDIDELNAAIGIALAAAPAASLLPQLTHIQHQLFSAGSELAAPQPEKFNLPLLLEHEITRLEQWIDDMEAELPQLRNFILPGGSPAAAALHLARTICRRAERSVVALAESASIRPEIIIYLNRLSDYLFVASRYENQKAGTQETVWKP